MTVERSEDLIEALDRIAQAIEQFTTAYQEEQEKREERMDKTADAFDRAFKQATHVDVPVHLRPVE